MGYQKILKEAWKDFSVLCIKMMTLPYSIEVQGRENMPEGRAIIAANHESFADPVFLVSGLKMKVYFLVKHYLLHAEGFEKSFFGKYFSSVDQIILKNGEITRTTLKMAVRTLEDDGRDNKLGIFPEGTRSLDGKLGKVQDGAALIAYLSKAPVIPIGINGTYEIWPRHKKFPRLYGKVRLNIGKPVYIDNKIDKHVAIKDLTTVLENELLRLTSGENRPPKPYHA